MSKTNISSLSNRIIIQLMPLNLPVVLAGDKLHTCPLSQPLHIGRMIFLLNIKKPCTFCALASTQPMHGTRLCKFCKKQKKVNFASPKIRHPTCKGKATHLDLTRPCANRMCTRSYTRPKHEHEVIGS